MYRELLGLIVNKQINYNKVNKRMFIKLNTYNATQNI